MILTQVHLNWAAQSVYLQLARVPLFLRFTVIGKTWDALDQVDDQPNPGEELIAAKLSGRGTVHIDRTVKGKRVGEWIPTADYDPCEEQPSQDVMRSTVLWREWCHARKAE